MTKSAASQIRFGSQASVDRSARGGLVIEKLDANEQGAALLSICVLAAPTAPKAAMALQFQR
ncbi:hypothetical protein ACWGH5_36790 [Streptomyces sp. NPDC054864]